MPSNASTVQKDVGAYIAPEFSALGVTGLAGGSGDNTEDDVAFHAPGDEANSFAIVIAFTTTLDEDETLTISANAQDATDISGTAVADFQSGSALAATVVATGGSGGSTETGTVKVRHQDIRSHRGFIRSQVTGDLSRGATDTFEYSVIHVYGGTRTIPSLT